MTPTMEKYAPYLPEGDRIDTPDNRAAIATITALMQAQHEGKLLEGRCVRCDAEHNLYVKLPCGEGIIPHCEGAVGIAEGTTKDIVLITRVNKPVCFVVTGFRHTEAGCQPILSRRNAQERCKEEFWTVCNWGISSLPALRGWKPSALSVTWVAVCLPCSPSRTFRSAASCTLPTA